MLQSEKTMFMYIYICTTSILTSMELTENVLQLNQRISFTIFYAQDTAGSERYEAMSRIYYRGAKAAIVCYGKPSIPQCYCV